MSVGSRADSKRSDLTGRDVRLAPEGLASPPRGVSLAYVGRRTKGPPAHFGRPRFGRDGTYGNMFP